MALQVSSVSLFDGGPAVVDVYARPEYMHLIKNKAISEAPDTKEKTVSYQYKIAITIAHYTDQTNAESVSSDQPFKTVRVENEITKEAFDAFWTLLYGEIKKDAGWSECADI